MPLTRIVYCSTHVIPPARFFAEIRSILEVSIRNNSRASLSGYMVFDDHRIAQILEGESELVEARFRRIAGDHRHRDVRVLEQVAASERLFATWSMGACLWLNELRDLLTSRGLTSFQPEKMPARDIVVLAQALSAREQVKRSQSQEKWAV